MLRVLKLLCIYYLLYHHWDAEGHLSHTANSVYVLALLEPSKHPISCFTVSKHEKFMQISQEVYDFCFASL